MQIAAFPSRLASRAKPCAMKKATDSQILINNFRDAHRAFKEHSGQIVKLFIFFRASSNVYVLLLNRDFFRESPLQRFRNQKTHFASCPYLAIPNERFEFLFSRMCIYRW